VLSSHLSDIIDLLFNQFFAIADHHPFHFDSEWKWQLRPCSRSRSPHIFKWQS